MKVKEEGNYRFFHLRLTTVMYEKLKTVADNQERSVSGLVKYILSRYIKQLTELG